MTTVVRAAEAPRAASSISSSSTRCSCTGVTKRLDQENVTLATVRLQLHFQAVVGEPLNPHRVQRHVQLGTYFRRQLGVGAAAEHHDVSQDQPLSASVLVSP